MSGIAKERADLARADRAIEDGEVRVARQTALIAELRRDGHQTREPEKLLWLLQQSLEAWKAHRALIRAALERSMEKRSVGGP